MISGLTITLFSPLPILPVADDLVTRYESVGYLYDVATNAADNGDTPASTVDVNVTRTSTACAPCARQKFW